MILTKAYITKLPDEGSNIYKVRVPLMEDNTGTEAIFDALLCTSPICYNGYSVGDCVYIHFEDDDYDLPVILGKLFTEIPTTSNAYIIANELNITNTSKLPNDSTLGEYRADDIGNLYNATGNVLYSNDTNVSHQSDSNTLIIDIPCTENHWTKKEITTMSAEGDTTISTYYVYLIASTLNSIEKRWVELNPDYVTYDSEGQEVARSKIEIPSDYALHPELMNVNDKSFFLWDIEVIPPVNETDMPYKAQVKNRAICTTLVSHRGYLELTAMKQPVSDMKLSLTGGL